MTTDVGVPVLWWRSVGSTHTAYSTEVFIDEVAQAAGKDPVEFRRALLKDQPRHLRRARPRGREGRLGHGRAGGPLPRRRRAQVVRHLRRPGGRDLARGRTAGSRSSGWSARSTAASRSTPTSSGRRSRAASATGWARSSRARSRSTAGRVVQGNFDELPGADDRRDARGRGPHRALDRAARPASASPACRRSGRRSPTPSSPPPASGSGSCRSAATTCGTA